MLSYSNPAIPFWSLPTLGNWDSETLPGAIPIRVRNRGGTRPKSESNTERCWVSDRRLCGGSQGEADFVGCALNPQPEGWGTSLGLIATPPAPCPHVLEDRWLTGDKKPMTKRTSVSRDATPNHSLFF